MMALVQYWNVYRPLIFRRHLFLSMTIKKIIFWKMNNLYLLMSISILISLLNTIEIITARQFHVIEMNLMDLARGMWAWLNLIFLGCHALFFFKTHKVGNWLLGKKTLSKETFLSHQHICIYGYIHGKSSLIYRISRNLFLSLYLAVNIEAI